MDLQYGRKQYSIKQYGKYKSSGKEEIKGLKKIFKGKSRIKGVKKSKESTSWVVQDLPVIINENAVQLRLKSNIGRKVYSQTISVNSHKKKLRLKANGKTMISSGL